MLDSSQNQRLSTESTESLKQDSVVLEVNSAQETFVVIFRNQQIEDTSLTYEKSKVSFVSDLLDSLYSKLNIDKSKFAIRLFFKGRILTPKTSFSNLSK